MRFLGSNKPESMNFGLAIFDSGLPELIASGWFENVIVTRDRVRRKPVFVIVKRGLMKDKGKGIKDEAQRRERGSD